MRLKCRGPQVLLEDKFHSGTLEHRGNCSPGSFHVESEGLIIHEALLREKFLEAYWFFSGKRAHSSGIMMQISSQARVGNCSIFSEQDQSSYSLKSNRSAGIASRSGKEFASVGSKTLEILTEYLRFLKNLRAIKTKVHGPLEESLT